MKKILLTGIVILLAAFVVTCDEFFPTEEKEVEYTDVLYSEDGSQVTVYLDGIGVPKTKAQRAMSLGLSQMAYDFIEVIFMSSATNRARSQWELGESAGISGVARGVDYGSGDTAPTALMAVGTKDGKTLLGVGHLISADGIPAYTAGAFPTADVTIGPNTKFVTFGLTSVKTGLQVGAVPVLPTGVTNSFGPPTTITGSISTLAGTDYPTFSINPNTTADDVSHDATYTFQGAAATYKDVLKWPAAGKVEVVKRIPRYMEGGRYLIARGRIDTKTKVEAKSINKNVVTLTFTVPPAASGIFSFYVDVPVNLLLEYNAVASPDLDANAGTNGGYLQSVNWHLRTGFGSDLYSLDDGLSSGGCVLMGVNVGSLDWLEIQWVWEKV